MNLVIGKNSIISFNLKKWLSADYISHKEVKHINKKEYDAIYLISFPEQYRYANEENFLFEKEIFNEFNGKKIIYFSTSKVYPYHLLCSENDTLEPQSFYSENKVKIENIIPNYTNKYFIFRISNAFDYKNFSKNTFFDILSKNYYKNKNIEFDICIDSKKDFITLDSISYSIAEVVKKNNYGVYNIGSEIGIQIKQILQYIFESDEVLDKVISNNSVILNQTLNTKKLRLEIGQRKKMFHDEAVKEIKRINFE